MIYFYSLKDIYISLKCVSDSSCPYIYIRWWQHPILKCFNQNHSSGVKPRTLQYIYRFTFPKQYGDVPAEELKSESATGLNKLLLFYFISFFYIYIDVHVPIGRYRMRSAQMTLRNSTKT